MAITPLGIVGFIIAGVIVSITLLVVAVYTYRKLTTPTTDPESANRIEGKPTLEFFDDINRKKPTKFSSRQLTDITKNFKHRLGEGSFGVVFKGKLENGVQVAVKVLKETAGEKLMKKQFMAEVNSVGRIHHFNLVKLHGYCFEQKKKALVFEFIENGSLADLLFSSENNREWEKLHEIAVGTAKGIACLHEDCEERIIHHDIKPENILLDRNSKPRVADFGLARLYNRDATHLTPTCFKGTVGYAAPEVFTGLPITCQCDVYSYGMLLFEILGRRRNLVGNKLEDWLPGIVWKRFEDGHVREMLMGFGIEERDRDKAERMVMVALWCAQQRPELRPRMSNVVKMLEGEVGINAPPNPFPANMENRLVLDGSRLQEFGNSTLHVSALS